MKEYKICETEKEIKKVMDEIQDYAEKRGLRIFAIIGEAVLPEKAAILIDNPRSCKLKEISHRLQAFDMARKQWVCEYARRMDDLGILPLDEIFGGDDDGED